jgi:hypothetical protein
MVLVIFICLRISMIFLLASARAEPGTDSLAPSLFPFGLAFPMAVTLPVLQLISPFSKRVIHSSIVEGAWAAALGIQIRQMKRRRQKACLVLIFKSVG